MFYDISTFTVYPLNTVKLKGKLERKEGKYLQDV